MLLNVRAGQACIRAVRIRFACYLGLVGAMKKTTANTYLEAARTACLERGLNLTPLRQRVYREIISSGSIGAYDIAERLRTPNQRANAVTVYRALEFLLDVGLVYKINSTKKYAATPLDSLNKSKNFSFVIVCEKTGASVKIESRELNDFILRLTKEAGFKMTQATVEVVGSSCS